MGRCRAFSFLFFSFLNICRALLAGSGRRAASPRSLTAYGLAVLALGEPAGPLLCAVLFGWLDCGARWPLSRSKRPQGFSEIE